MPTKVRIKLEVLWYFKLFINDDIASRNIRLISKHNPRKFLAKSPHKLRPFIAHAGEF